MFKVLQVSSTTWYCFLAAKTDLWIVELWVRLSFLWVCSLSWFCNCLFDCLLVKQSFLAAWSSTSDDKALRSLGRGERWQFKISNQSMLKLVKQRWNFVLKFHKTVDAVFQHLSANCHTVSWPSGPKYLTRDWETYLETLNRWRNDTTTKELKCRIYERKLCIWEMKIKTIGWSRPLT